MRSPGWARRCPRWSRVSSSTWRGGGRWRWGVGGRGAPRAAPPRRPHGAAAPAPAAPPTAAVRAGQPHAGPAAVGGRRAGLPGRTAAAGLGDPRHRRHQCAVQLLAGVPGGPPGRGVAQTPAPGRARAPRRHRAAGQGGRAEACAITDAPNCVLAGTTVLEGTGEGIVFATAAATAFGSVAALTERLYLEPSPLQREVAVTARIIAAVAITIGVVFFLAGTATERLPTRDSFLFGVGILVAIIPEGLLPTVTLALALGVQRMGHRNAIIKRLSSVEALGSTNVICTDKTGTITINEMTARQLWAGDAHYTVTGRGYRLRGGVRGVGTGAEGHGSAPTRLLRRGGRGD